MLSGKKFTLMSAAFSKTLLELVKRTAGTFKWPEDNDLIIKLWIKCSVW